MELSEAIYGCKKNNPTAQQYLFDQYSEQMYALCYRYVKNAEDAEELMLDGFFNFFRKIDHFLYSGESSVLPWLKKIMINECLMFLRKNKSFINIALEDYEDVSLSNQIIERISAKDIYRMILELPVGYRTVFNLFVIEGLSHKEIAKTLHITEGTSKSQLSKARNILQLMISKSESIKHKKLYG
ncbi:MAG: sigma-70 family RNA polymerase sigma factor [Chitinophagaceae bacterium]|jgi:RNA polymerase sigma-70 factor (ECF subfamily)|nr:MAG: sigma-70 family RNA polymerase sigma factor [Chitinophagaceae bacterium]